MTDSRSSPASPPAFTETTHPPPQNVALFSPARLLRRRRLWGFFSGLAALVVVALIWNELSPRGIESTDDAYIAGNILPVASQIPGTVTHILADNTAEVSAGELLIELDPTDARMDLARARAELLQAIRSARGLFANTERFAADVRLRQVESDKARADLGVRQALASSGVISKEELRHAQDAFNASQAALLSAEKMRIQAIAQTDGSTITSNPSVQMATERLRAAALAVERTRVFAPAGGMVAQRNAQVGKRVGTGERLLTIVPLDQLWVDANFKEVQIKDIRPGQSATVTADIYGSSVVYHGKVAGVEAGTGSAFALLPPQNATGNWIKVVQRTPVRILLDPGELRRHPLRVGMSAAVSVDTGEAASASPPKRAAVGDVTAFYDAQARAADAVVRETLDAGLQETSP